jgi:hypothetical protein
LISVPREPSCPEADPLCLGSFGISNKPLWHFKG